MEINLQTVIAYNIWRLANHSRSHAKEEEEEAYIHTHTGISTYIQIQIYIDRYKSPCIQVYKQIHTSTYSTNIHKSIRIYVYGYTYEKRSENIYGNTYIYNTGCPIYKHTLISVIGTRIRFHYIHAYTWSPLARSLVCSYNTDIEAHTSLPLNYVSVQFRMRNRPKIFDTWLMCL